MGVPQGSVLGPLFFNIFINDIVFMNDCKKILFADDAVLYVSGETIESCLNRVNSVINRLETWLDKNRLTPNIEKTKLMLFKIKRSVVPPDIYFKGKRLEWVDSFCYLGITVDNKLSFNIHCKKVVNKLSSAHGIMWSISNFFPMKILMNIFYSLVYPIIIQDIILWGGTYRSYLSNVKIYINKILRCILKATSVGDDFIPIVRTNALYVESNVMMFDDVYRYFLLKFIHFITYRRFDIFMEYFFNLLPMHDYPTRNVRIHLPQTRLDVEKNFTLYKSAELINTIDEDFLNQQSNYTLKKKFKTMCIDSYR